MAITWPYFTVSKKSKRHFIPHVILVQMIYKISCADKWPLRIAKLKMDFQEKKALSFIASYMVSSLTYKKSLGYLKEPIKIVFHILEIALTLDIGPGHALAFFTN